MTATAMQGINMKTTGVHHVALRSTDLARAKVFYVDRLGFPLLLASAELFLFLAGGTAIGVRGPSPDTPPEDVFNPFRVGLDHIALGCTDALELHRVAAALTQAGVEHTGVKTDELLQKEYIAFKDPTASSGSFTRRTTPAGTGARCCAPRSTRTSRPWWNATSTPFPTLTTWCFALHSCPAVPRMRCQAGRRSARCGGSRSCRRSTASR